MKMYINFLEVGVSFDNFSFSTISPVVKPFTKSVSNAMALVWKRITAEIGLGIVGSFINTIPRKIPSAPRNAPHVNKNICRESIGYPQQFIGLSRIMSRVNRMTVKKTYRMRVLPKLAKEKNSGISSGTLFCQYAMMRPEREKMSVSAVKPVYYQKL